MTLGTMASLAGGITKAGGQFLQAQEEAHLLGYNAFLEGQQARFLEKQKKFDLDKLKNRRRKVLGRQVATTAASGRGFYGSALSIMVESEKQALIDEHITKFNADMAIGRSYSKRSLLRAQAGSRRLTGTAQALTTLTESGINAAIDSGIGV